MTGRTFCCLGVSHKTAPMEVRETLDFQLADLIARRVENRVAGPDEQNSEPSELALLRTCNRVELYATVESPRSTPRDTLEALLLAGAREPEGLAGSFYYLENGAAVRHLCRVASGLDSIILGETQILGQVGEALLQAKRHKTSGRVLRCVFQAAVRSGRRARRETAIGCKPLSPSSAALTWAEERLGTLEDKTVVVVGVGAVGILVAKALWRRGVRNVLLVNRDRERGREVAEQFGFSSASFSDLPVQLGRADLAILATSASTQVLGVDLMKPLSRQLQRGLMLLDLGVPRNVDPAVGNLDGISLIQSDELQRRINMSLQARESEIPQVERIMDEELQRLGAPWRDQSHQLVGDLRRRSEAIRRFEVKRLLGRIEDAPPETVDHIRKFSCSLVNHLLHEPTTRLKRSADRGEWRHLEHTVRDLFDIHSGDG